jgi:hypothetical protein
MCHKRPQAALFDCYVRNGEKPGWHGEAERLGGVEIDYEFEFGGLKNWQVGGLGTPKYTARTAQSP